jgi:hypothetical protein
LGFVPRHGQILFHEISWFQASVHPLEWRVYGVPHGQTHLWLPIHRSPTALKVWTPGLADMQCCATEV